MSDPLITISQLLCKLIKSAPEPLEKNDILPLKFSLERKDFIKLQALSSLGLNSKDETIELLLKHYEEILLKSIPKNDFKVEHQSYVTEEQTFSFQNRPDFDLAKELFRFKY